MSDASIDKQPRGMNDESVNIFVTLDITGQARVRDFFGIISSGSRILRIAGRTMQNGGSTMRMPLPTIGA